MKCCRGSLESRISVKSIILQPNSSNCTSFTPQVTKKLCEHSAWLQKNLEPSTIPHLINITTELAHPVLNTILGLDHGKTVHYRGLKYASLEHPFAEPLLLTSSGSSTISCNFIWVRCPTYYQESLIYAGTEHWDLVALHAHRIHKYETMSLHSSNTHYRVKNLSSPILNV